MKNHACKAASRRGRPHIVPTHRHAAKLRVERPLFACTAFCLVAFAGASAQAAANSPLEVAYVDFDTETLKKRGLDPKLAEYFRGKPKFNEGRNLVTLFLNGSKVGKVPAVFDGQGELRFDEGFLAKAGLNPPEGITRVSGLQSNWSTAEFIAAYPNTVITLRPNREEVHLIVPQTALAAPMADLSAFSTGGLAAIANYDLTAIRSQFGSRSRRYLSASTQLGANVGDWVLRSQQVYTQQAEMSRFEHLYAYGQRTFAQHKAVLQAGQININSPLISGGAITGVQFMPEGALLQSSGVGALVEGIAHDQATVEVRQAGALIYSTLVPEGNFALDDIPLLNSNADLDVTVRELNGAERHFVVPAASFRNRAASPGYSFAVGKVRDIGGAERRQPWVATASGTWSVRNDLSASAAAMAAQGYVSAGWGTDFELNQGARVSVQNVFSNATQEGKRGMQISVSPSFQATTNLAINLSATQQTEGFRYLSDTLLRSDAYEHKYRYKGQYTASASWASDVIGSTSITYSSSHAFNGDAHRRVIGSWGKSFKRMSITASVEKSLGGGGHRGQNNLAAYVNLSIPFGHGSLRTFANKRGDDLRTGAAYTGLVSDQLNYRLAAERSTDRGDVFASANVSAVPRYTSVDLGYAQSGNSHKSYTGRISGGAVAHKNGVTLSPYPVQDTFGIVDVGDLAGVKIATPAGPVWTDLAGQAVVPRLNAYRNSRIEVQTKTLPRRVDLHNGVLIVGAGRGSVNHMNFDTVTARRVMVHAKNSDGTPLLKGASVVDDQGNFVTAVLDKGVVFLNDANPDSVLKVRSSAENTCLLEIDFPKEIDHESFYDEASATCT